MSKARENKCMKHARSGIPCIRCGRSGRTPQGEQIVYGRHYNGQRQHQYGKGRGIKCHYVMIADFCDFCDAEFREGSVPKDDTQARDSYSEEFQHWCIMSHIRRLDEGVL